MEKLEKGNELTAEELALVDRIVEALTGDRETAFGGLNQSMQQQKAKYPDSYENIIVEARRRVNDISKQREALQREQGNNN